MPCCKTGYILTPKALEAVGLFEQGVIPESSLPIDWLIPTHSKYGNLYALLNPRQLLRLFSESSSQVWYSFRPINGRLFLELFLESQSDAAYGMEMRR